MQFPEKENKNKQSRNSLLSEYIGSEGYNWMSKYADFDNDRTAVFAASNIIPLKLTASGDTDVIVNLVNLNEIPNLTGFIRTLNEKLPNEGLFIGKAYTLELRREKMNRRYSFFIRQVVMFLDFIVNRILPRLIFFRNIYSSYTRGASRNLSLTEVLGQLYAGGFELVDSKIIHGKLVFCVRKITPPLVNKKRKYGLFIALKRIGKNKKEISIYKLRTMYPYAEYIQQYVYDRYGTKDGDKATDDFRITRWGHFLRKVWLDELPMLINLLKGDVKIVGVRPLSPVKFKSYPHYLQEKRVKNKPGLIPPFYADLPQTQAEFYESESHYLDLYSKNPIKTDIKYFFRAFYNIIFKNARSK